jgi:hypothetical protein
VGIVPKLTYSLAVGAALALFSTAPALAGEANVYRYQAKSSENYCPSGLQPVTVDGSFGCGVPNHAQTYQQAMRHPAQRGTQHHNVQRYSALPNCLEGSKGCS